MTRKERHIRALRLAEDFLAGGAGARSHDETLEAVQYALGAPCPAWWAEHVYEQRGIEREYREEPVTITGDSDVRYVVRDQDGRELDVKFTPVSPYHQDKRPLS